MCMCVYLGRGPESARPTHTHFATCSRSEANEEKQQRAGPQTHSHVNALPQGKLTHAAQRTDPQTHQERAQGSRAHRQAGRCSRSLRPQRPRSPGRLGPGRGWGL